MRAAILSLAFLCLLWVGAANATVALVQQNNGNPNSTSVTVTFAASQNCVTGNVVILEFSGFGTGTVAASSVSNLGNAVWTKVIGELAGSGNGSSEIWVTTCGSTPGFSSTVTFTVATQVNYNMSEWSGLTATQDSGSPKGSTTSYIAPSLTTTNATDLLIANAVTSASPPTAPSSPWVSLTTSSTFEPASYQITSSTGTFSAFTAGGAGTTQASAFAAFKATSAAVGLKGFFIP